MVKFPSRERIQKDIEKTPPRRPSWIRVQAPSGESYEKINQLMRRKSLHTVCEEALCPNIGECYASGTATFLMLGDICTRRCVFCDVKFGKPTPLDYDEPYRIAQAVKSMNLNHAVITSVNRDDCEDGGAEIFASVIHHIRENQPNCTVEVLIPDFKANLHAIKTVVDAKPDILNHNVETVPRLFPKIQPQDHYDWARVVLTSAKQFDRDLLTKSGIMVGLGETMAELKVTMRDLREWNVDILTIGQYLQPSRSHLSVERYYSLEEFTDIKQYGLDLGFRWVESGPLVRSSYHASEQVKILSSVKQ